MANPKHLTSVERKKRKEMRTMIRDAKRLAQSYRAGCIVSTARLLDDLARVAERYLEEKHGEH